MFFQPPILKRRPEIGNLKNNGKKGEEMFVVAFCIADRFQIHIASCGEGNT